MINETAYNLGSCRSCIRELFEYGRQRAEVVGADNVFDYSLGNPSIPAPKEVGEALEAILRDMDSLEIHGYTTAIGDLQTRQAIADDLSRRWGNVKAEELFLTCGAAPALTAVFHALACPEGEILAIAPYFPEYRPFAETAGLAFRVVPPDVPEFQIRLEAVEAMLTPRTVAVIINSPNNPSGRIYSRETLEKLGKLLKEKEEAYGHPIYIVSDEPYRELVYGGREVPCVRDIYPDTVVCYSYAKSLSLPGERIGYVYVPSCAREHQKLYAAIAGAARAMGHVCAPSLQQKLIARCAHLRPNLEAYDENRRLLCDGLRAMGYEVAEPEGAFYLFVKTPGENPEDFYQRAKEKDLLVVPGDGFGCPGYFRICYCVQREKIERSLPVFRILMEES